MKFVVENCSQLEGSQNVFSLHELIQNLAKLCIFLSMGSASIPGKF